MTDASNFEEILRRAHVATENRDWTKSDADQLRTILSAALEIPETPLLEVTDEMTRAGISAFKFSMWRSLCYAGTIEETLAHVYRVMADKDKTRMPSHDR